MSTKSEASLGQATECSMKHELGHLRKHGGGSCSWASCWPCAALPPSFSPITVLTTFVVVSMLAVILMIAGVATIIGSFWAGKWGGFLVQLLVGILYVAASLVITERPLATPLMMTIFIAVSFMVIGVFRVLASLIVRFPQWGWAMLTARSPSSPGSSSFDTCPPTPSGLLGCLWEWNCS